MRPNSSKVVEFISSWMAFGWSGMVILAVGALQRVEAERRRCR